LSVIQVIRSLFFFNWTGAIVVVMVW
jgi:hypothetical protein